MNSSPYSVFPIKSSEYFTTLGDYGNGICIAVITRAKALPEHWGMAKKAIHQSVETNNGCNDGELSSEYIMGRLESSSLEYIFCALVGVNSYDMIIPRTGILAYALCTEQDQGIILIDVDALCSLQITISSHNRDVNDEPVAKSSKQTTVLKLGIGVVLMSRLIDYFLVILKQDVLLHAASQSLIPYYAKMGFILMPLKYGCTDLNPRYVKMFREASTVNEYYRLFSLFYGGKADPVALGYGDYMILCADHQPPNLTRMLRTQYGHKTAEVMDRFWSDYRYIDNKSLDSNSYQCRSADQRDLALQSIGFYDGILYCGVKRTDRLFNRARSAILLSLSSNKTVGISSSTTLDLLANDDITEIFIAVVKIRGDREVPLLESLVVVAWAFVWKEQYLAGLFRLEDSIPFSLLSYAMTLNFNQLIPRDFVVTELLMSAGQNQEMIKTMGKLGFVPNSLTTRKEIHNWRSGDMISSDKTMRLVKHPRVELFDSEHFWNTFRYHIDERSYTKDYIQYANW